MKEFIYLYLNDADYFVYTTLFFVGFSIVGLLVLGMRKEGRQ